MNSCVNLRGNVPAIPPVEVTRPGWAWEGPFHRTIVGVDAEGSTTLTNPQKAWLRAAMYGILWRALAEIGIDKRSVTMLDRGDGVLTLIPPFDHVPKTRLLDTFIPALDQLLAAHNRMHHDQRFRLRAAVHAGEVHSDQQGWFGEDIDINCRLLDSLALKHVLRMAEAPVARRLGLRPAGAGDHPDVQGVVT